MHLDLDTFLVGLYSLVDDLWQTELAPHKPRRPGPKPQMSDSEILTLLLCGQWLGNSERRLLRFVQTYWQAYFPRLLSQSAFNRRGRDLAGALAHLVPCVARHVPEHLSAYQVLDGVPLPLARRCRGDRHRQFANEASIGRGGSDRDWYYGCQVLLAVAADGLITGFVLAPAATEERWVAETLLCWRNTPLDEPWTAADMQAVHDRRGGYVGPTGPIWPRHGVGQDTPCLYLSDRGLAGVDWTTHWQRDYQAVVVTARDYALAHDELPLREHASRRQVIETVNAALSVSLHLAFPRARTLGGLLSRVAAKLVACNLAIWLNRLCGRPDLAIGSLFPG